MSSYFPLKAILLAIAILALCSGCTGHSSVGVSYSNYWEPYRGHGPRIHYNYNVHSHRHHSHNHHRHGVGRPHHRDVNGPRRPKPSHRPHGHR